MRIKIKLSNIGIRGILEGELYFYGRKVYFGLGCVGIYVDGKKRSTVAYSQPLLMRAEQRLVCVTVPRTGCIGCSLSIVIAIFILYLSGNIKYAIKCYISSNK